MQSCLVANVVIPDVEFLYQQYELFKILKLKKW